MLLIVECYEHIGFIHSDIFKQKSAKIPQYVRHEQKKRKSSKQFCCFFCFFSGGGGGFVWGFFGGFFVCVFLLLVYCFWMWFLALKRRLI